MPDPRAPTMTDVQPFPCPFVELDKPNHEGKVECRRFLAGTYRVMCSHCGTVMLGMDEAEAIARWNTRAEPEEVAALRAAVAGFVEEHEAYSLCNDPESCGRVYKPRFGITQLCNRCDLIKDAEAALAKNGDE